MTVLNELDVDGLHQKLEVLLGEAAGERAGEWAELLHRLQVHEVELEIQNRELHETQVALEASRSRYADLYDLAPVGYLTLDGHGHILESNLKAAELLGLPRERLAGRPLAARLAQGQSAALHNYLRSIFSSAWPPRTSQGIELVVEVKGATQRTVLMEAVRVDDDGASDDSAAGSPHCRATLLDISVRKQAEERLRESETRFRELFENMNDGVAVYDAVGDGEDFVFAAHNEAGERITGIPRSQVIGRPVREAFPGIEAMGLFQVFQRVWRSGKPERFPRTEYKDGQFDIWVDNYVFKLPSGQIVTIYTDVTKQRQAEEALRESESRFRAMYELAADGILLADPDSGRILDANPAAAHMLHRARKQIIGLPQTALYPPQLRERARRAFAEQLRDADPGQPTQPAEIAFLRPDGSELHVEAVTQMISYLGRQVLMGTFRGLTERKRAEESERRLLAAQTAATVRSQLVSNVSHELRTPLTSLRGFTELLLNREYPREKQRELLGIIERDARRLNQLVDDFLDLQRMASGFHVYRFQNVSLRAVVDEVLAIYRKENGIHRFRTRIPGELPAVRADASRLRQALQNLLSNAVKYSPEGGRITVGAQSKGGHLAVWVSDQGIGIPLESQPLVFERFYRVEDAEHRRIRGTGLGLALVSEIVHAHGGWCWVESEPGKGSTFYLTLPVAEDEPGDE